MGDPVENRRQQHPAEQQRPGPVPRRRRRRRARRSAPRRLGTRTPDTTRRHAQALARHRGRRRRPTRRRARRRPRGQPRRLRRPRRPHPHPPRRPRRTARPDPHRPGLGTRPRVYAAGDRILVHTNLGRGPDRQVFNGTTGTVFTPSQPTAPRCSSTKAASVFLPAATHRRDARPTAHPTSRTRGPAPSTAPKAAPGARSTSSARPPSTVTPATSAKAAANNPPTPGTPAPTPTTQPDSSPTNAHPAKWSPTRCAAPSPRPSPPHDDPWPLDRQLRAERDQHAAIVASRPTDHAPNSNARAPRSNTPTPNTAPPSHALAVSEQERAQLGPLTRLRRGGRDDITRADQALAGARTSPRPRRHHTRTTRTPESTAARKRSRAAPLGTTNIWRIDRIAEIDHTLAHHWADVTLRAVHADDPLAFGTQQLRDAAATYLADLQRTSSAVCPTTPRRADPRQADLCRHQHHQRDAGQSVADSPQPHSNTPATRHGYRRDKSAITDRTRRA